MAALAIARDSLVDMLAVDTTSQLVVDAVILVCGAFLFLYMLASACFQVQGLSLSLVKLCCTVLLGLVFLSSTVHVARSSAFNTDQARAMAWYMWSVVYDFLMGVPPESPPTASSVSIPIPVSTLMQRVFQ